MYFLEPQVISFENNFRNDEGETEIWKKEVTFLRLLG